MGRSDRLSNKKEVTLFQKGTFQVIARRESEEHRVIGALNALLDDPHLHLFIPGAVLSDLEEFRLEEIIGPGRSSQDFSQLQGVGDSQVHFYSSQTIQTGVLCPLIQRSLGDIVD